jgi:hypothetical protein
MIELEEKPSICPSSEMIELEEKPSSLAIFKNDRIESTANSHMLQENVVLKSFTFTNAFAFFSDSIEIAVVKIEIAVRPHQSLVIVPKVQSLCPKVQRSRVAA